jgi:hypothetical protein
VPWVAFACLVPLTYARLITQDHFDAHPHEGRESYASAQLFAPHIAPGAIILASGGSCTDAEGEPAAYNASYMFYWLDRKGFNICRQGQSADSVARFASRGAQYFIAEKRMLALNKGMEDELRGRYPVLAESPFAMLFDLRRPSALAAVPQPGKASK